MRRFSSAPMAIRASRVPSGERIAEDPRLVSRLASTPISALRRIDCGDFGARSTKPMANATVVDTKIAAAAQARCSRQIFFAGVAVGEPQLAAQSEHREFRCGHRQRLEDAVFCLFAGSGARGVGSPAEWF